MRAVIIGNSAAALAAAGEFRRRDPASELAMISAEPGPAYSRALLPYFLSGSLPRGRLFVRDGSYYESLGIHTRFEAAVLRVDDRRRTLTLEDGSVTGYDRLLVATGARPAKPRIEDLQGPGIHYFWTLEDADNLAPELRPGRRIAFIGSGFVSLQAAWAAHLRGLRVAILEALPRILPKVLDQKASALLEAKMREHGADVRSSVGIERIERPAGGDPPLRVLLACGEPAIDADLAVVGAGVRPKLEFLEGTQVRLAADGAGILVDERMRTSVPDIFAAGDVALGPSVFGEAYAACALWPTAVEQGRVAGANLAGHEQAYRGSLNMNVAEMFGLTVASLGRFSPSGETNESVIEEHDPHSGRYVKLLFRDGVPLGGVVIGSAEDLAVLAALRPRIRLRLPARPEPQRPFAELHHRLARPRPGLASRS
jgi:NADPH-dependent 2,4-dienoyl-CoA reductase/sulfur reductase-like enzyme